MASVLEAAGIVKRFGSLAALDGVDLSLEQGEILGVIGPNGSGKSTLFKVLSGILKPDAGRVRLLGADVTGKPDWRICRMGLALTGQVASPLAEMTVLENAVVAATFGGGQAQPRGQTPGPGNAGAGRTPGPGHVHGRGSHPGPTPQPGIGQGPGHRAQGPAAG